MRFVIQVQPRGRPTKNDIGGLQGPLPQFYFELVIIVKPTCQIVRCVLIQVPSREDRNVVSRKSAENLLGRARLPHKGRKRHSADTTASFPSVLSATKTRGPRGLKGAARHWLVSGVDTRTRPI